MNTSTNNKYSEGMRKLIIKSFSGRKLINTKNRNYQVQKLIDKSIKVGDQVFLHDGSSLSLKSDDEKDLTAYYIVFPYPELTGLGDDLMYIKSTVVETGVKDKAITSSVNNIAYLQDIVVKVGNAEFRTSSQLVHNINNTQEYEF